MARNDARLKALERERGAGDNRIAVALREGDKWRVESNMLLDLAGLHSWAKTFRFSVVIVDR